MRRAAGAQQAHIVRRGAASGKAGGSLDIVGPAVGHDAAEHALFLLGQQAALNDDLEDAAAADLAHGADIGRDIVPAAVLDHGQVDDHVHLIGTVADGLGRLERLDGRGVVPVREADDRADAQAVADIFLRPGDMARRDAHTGAAVTHALIAEGADLRRGGIHAQERVVAAGKNLSKFHDRSSFLMRHEK